MQGIDASFLVPVKHPHRQLRLTIPVTQTEKLNAGRLVKQQIDGAKSTAELVRKLLAERFARYMAERPNPDHAAKRAQGGRGKLGKLVAGGRVGLLVGGVATAPLVPAGRHVPRDRAGRGAGGGVTKDAPSAAARGSVRIGKAGDRASRAVQKSGTPNG